jgi:hypothetical protein
VKTISHLKKPPFKEYRYCKPCAAVYQRIFQRGEHRQPKAPATCVECGTVRERSSIWGVRCEPCGRKHRAARDTAKYQSDLEKSREKNRRKYAKTPAAYRKGTNRWRQANPELFAAIQREESAERRKDPAYRAQQKTLHTAWTKAHWKQILSNHSKWREENPEKWTAIIHRRRAREADAPGSHTGEELKALKASQDFRCFDCGERKPLTLGHGVPLSRGGTQYAWNLMWQCKSCNSRQHDHVHPAFERFYDPSADQGTRRKAGT